MDGPQESHSSVTVCMVHARMRTVTIVTGGSGKEVRCGGVSANAVWVLHL